jgi:hypothetical protein
MNALAESVEQVSNMPQVEAGVDDRQCSNAKPHAEHYRLLIHC